MPQFAEIKNILSEKCEQQQDIFIYLPQLSDFQKQEISFHDQITADEKEDHQLETLRNSYYHDHFKKRLFDLPKDSIFLEIGSGSGYDLWPVLRQGYKLIISDISQKSVEFVKKETEAHFGNLDERVIFLVSDGGNLPLPDNSVAAVFMAATFHHFENQQRALAEIKRVVKAGGLIILAIEPSSWMKKFTKLFSHSQRLRIYHDASVADEQYLGFVKSDFIKMAREQELKIVGLKRVWLLLGFLHYFLEGLYRFFKLKNRLRVPKILEALLLAIDEILLKVPGLNYLNWHWTVIFKKRD